MKEIIAFNNKKEVNQLLWGLKQLSNILDDFDPVSDTDEILLYNGSVIFRNKDDILTKIKFKELVDIEYLTKRQVHWLINSLTEVITEVNKITKKEPLFIYYLKNDNELYIEHNTKAIKLYNYLPPEFHNTMTITDDDLYFIYNICNDAYLLESYKAKSKDEIKLIKGKGTNIPFDIPVSIKNSFIKVSDIKAIIFNIYNSSEELNDYNKGDIIPVSVKFDYSKIYLETYYGILDLSNKDETT